MRHPLGMAPCAEAPHPVGYPVGGFYPSLASTFPAQFLPPTLLSVTHLFWRKGSRRVWTGSKCPAQGTSRFTRRFGQGIAACGTRSALCWSPVREGTYDILDCVNLATGHYASIDVRLAIQAWGTPSAWRHVPRPLIRWVIRSVGFIRALPVPSLPNSCHQPCCLLRFLSLRALTLNDILS